MDFLSSQTTPTKLILPGRYPLVLENPEACIFADSSLEQGLGQPPFPPLETLFPTPLPSPSPSPTPLPSPSQTPEITFETEINIWFDNSGSMNATLAPLEEMRATLLKDALLPIYGNDESVYNDRVQILYMNSETIEGYSTYESCILCAAKQKRDSSVTQIINLIFQDESSPYGFDPNVRTSDYENAVAVLRNVIQTDSSVYSVIFQVEGYPGFKQLLQATQGCLNAYQGIYGICDLPRIEINYDVISANDPVYYLCLIIQKLIDLGFTNLPSPEECSYDIISNRGTIISPVQAPNAEFVSLKLVSRLYPIENILSAPNAEFVSLKLVSPSDPIEEGLDAPNANIITSTLISKSDTIQGLSAPNATIISSALVSKSNTIQGLSAPNANIITSTLISKSNTIQGLSAPDADTISALIETYLSDWIEGLEAPEASLE